MAERADVAQVKRRSKAVLRRPAAVSPSTMSRRVTPIAFDDLTGEFGLKVLHQMMREPAIAAALLILKGALLKSKMILMPAEASDEDQDTADEMQEFCQKALGWLDDPISLCLDEMLDALALKSLPAELTWDYREIDGKTAFVITEVKPKAREAVSYIEDKYGRRIGYKDRRSSGTGLWMLPGSAQGEVLPLEKFLTLDFAKSVLRPAYNAYLFKLQLLPQYYTYIHNFANGRIIGFTAEDAEIEALNEDDDDDSDLTLQTPEQQMLEDLMAFQGNSAAAFPYGAEVDIHEPGGDGSAFLKSFDMANREMALGTIGLYQAIFEAEHSNKANSETAFNGVLTIFSRHRDSIAHQITKQLLRPLIRWNFGDEAVRLAPRFEFEVDRKDDLALLGEVIAKLFVAGVIKEQQLPAIYEMFGLPMITEEELELMRIGEEDELANLRRELAKVRAEGVPTDRQSVEEQA